MSKETASKLDTGFAKRFMGSETAYVGGVGHTSNFRLSNEYPDPAHEIKAGETKRLRAAGGQVMTATFYNPGQENLMLVHPGWFGDGEHANSKLQNNLLVQQNPDTTVAYVNMPGIRGTEALPANVMKEMKKTGSFEVYGEQVASAFDAVMKDFEKTKGVGWSTGARTMLGILASRHGESGLENVVGIDPPGTRKMGLVGIMKAFVLDEGGYAKLYQTDSQVVEAMKIGAPKSKTKLDSVWQGLYGFPVAMSKDGLAHDFEKAAKGLGRETKISIVSPELSGLNLPEDVARIMQQVSLGTDAQLLHYIIEGQSHSGIMDQHASLFTQMITDLNK